MALTLTDLWVILGCGTVTLLSRVLTFALLKKFQLPTVVIDFLSFVPIAIMTALCCESLFVAHAGHWATLNVANCMPPFPPPRWHPFQKPMVVVVVGIMAMALSTLLPNWIGDN